MIKIIANKRDSLVNWEAMSIVMTALCPLDVPSAYKTDYRA